jgi:isochorismate synthase EntC
MTDPTHLNDLVAAMSKPLSRRLVETFRNSSRDPSVSKTDYVQHLKNEMEAALQESQGDAATQSNNP